MKENDPDDTRRRQDRKYPSEEAHFKVSGLGDESVREEKRPRPHAYCRHTIVGEVDRVNSLLHSELHVIAICPLFSMHSARLDHLEASLIFVALDAIRSLPCFCFSLESEENHTLSKSKRRKGREEGGKERRDKTNWVELA